jgi:hypothetical protein
VLVHFACNTYLGWESDEGLDGVGFGAFMDELTNRMDETSAQANHLLLMAMVGRGGGLEQPEPAEQPDQPEPQADGDDGELPAQAG